MNRMPVMARISLKYGLYVTLAFIAYFLIMRLIGLADNTGLRYINYVILVFGMFMTASALHREHPPIYGYLPSMFTSLAVAFISAMVFALFLAGYTGLIDQKFLTEIQDEVPIHGKVTPIILGILVASEIFSIGIALSLAVAVYHQRYSSSIEKGKFEAQKRQQHAS